MSIDLSDYSRTAAQRGWGAGWPSCGGAKAAGTAAVSADLSGTRVSVHKRLARLVDLLIDATERRHGWLLKPGQCGGYNCRPIGGTRVPSNHSWGLAVDLNWNDNTYNSTGKHTMPTAVARMWNRYGFAWGGDYRGSKQDWMHLEFMGSPADADAMTALALRELVGGSSPPAAPAPAPAPPPGGGRPMLRVGSKGQAVRELQDWSNWYAWRPALPILGEDGIFGPGTERVVKLMQGQLGVAADGIVGGQTWAALARRGFPVKR